MGLSVVLLVMYPALSIQLAFAQVRGFTTCAVDVLRPALGTDDRPGMPGAKMAQLDARSADSGGAATASASR
jgi:hypothetical protein